MITGVNSSANNIFSASGDMTSRIRSASGSSSESHYHGLSKKDSASANSIAKDEIEYQIEDMMWDQQKETENEEWERIGGLFQD